MNRDQLKTYFLSFLLVLLFLLYEPLSDSTGHGVFMAPITKNHKSGVPIAPVLLSPSNGSHIEGTTPELSWSMSIEASSYTLQLDNNSGFSSPTMMTFGNIYDNSFIVTTELQHGRWFWRVRAENASGSGQFSEVWEFEIIPSRTSLTDTTIMTVVTFAAAIVSIMGLALIVVRIRRTSLKRRRSEVVTGLLSPKNATIIVIVVGAMAPYVMLYQTFTDPSTSDLYQTINLVAVFWQFLATADATHFEIISGFVMTFSMLVFVLHLAFALSINEYLRGKSTVLRVLIFWIVSQIPVLALSLPRYLTGSSLGSVFYTGPTFITLVTGLILMKLAPKDNKESWNESD